MLVGVGRLSRMVANSMLSRAVHHVQCTPAPVIGTEASLNRMSYFNEASQWGCFLSVHIGGAHTCNYSNSWNGVQWTFFVSAFRYCTRKVQILLHFSLEIAPVIQHGNVTNGRTVSIQTFTFLIWQKNTICRAMNFLAFPPVKCEEVVWYLLYVPYCGFVNCLLPFAS